MFIKACTDTAPHEPHEFTHRWHKINLPMLRDPEKYPDSWNAQYKCWGVSADSWEVNYLHPECPECEACAERAILRARHMGTHTETWRDMAPALRPTGLIAVPVHQATVTLK